MWTRKYNVESWELKTQGSPKLGMVTAGRRKPQLRVFETGDAEKPDGWTVEDAAERGLRKGRLIAGGAKNWGVSGYGVGTGKVARRKPKTGSIEEGEFEAQERQLKTLGGKIGDAGIGSLTTKQLNAEDTEKCVR